MVRMPWGWPSTTKNGMLLGSCMLWSINTDLQQVHSANNQPSYWLIPRDSRIGHSLAWVSNVFNHLGKCIKKWIPYQTKTRHATTLVAPAVPSSQQRRLVRFWTRKLSVDQGELQFTTRMREIFRRAEPTTNANPKPPSQRGFVVHQKPMCMHFQPHPKGAGLPPYIRPGRSVHRR